MSLYLHLPFCKKICSYCDFCKIIYDSKLVPHYLESLKQEFSEFYQGEPLSTIYIGGGTPNALSNLELEQVLQFVASLPKQKNFEYTIECNIEYLTKEQLELFRTYQINRLSIGVQTSIPKFLNLLGRHHTKKEVAEKMALIRSFGFENVNLDLMYALPGETMRELKQDLKFFLSLKPDHIATYSLMLEPHTKLYINEVAPISEELDAQMYEYICQTLKNAGYEHYEISNFSKPKKMSKHNLTYWSNQFYYGIGVGASGYLKGIRYSNTKSINQYLKKNWNRNEEILTKKSEMEYEILLGLRLLKGISLSSFLKKFQISLMEIFDVSSLLEMKILQLEQGFLSIPEQKLYISNEILLNFVD